MPPVTLQGHLCTGHGCYPSRPSVQGTAGFVVNGRPVICVGDRYAVHICLDGHDGVLARGAAGFVVNGNAIGRIGDPVSCGSAVAEGIAGFIVREAS